MDPRLSSPLSKERVHELERACAVHSNQCTQTKLFFDDFESSLPHIVQSYPPMVGCVEHLPGMDFGEKYKITLKVTNASLGVPCVINRNGDVDNNLSPTRCRIESLNYAAPLYFEISVQSQEPSNQGAIYSGSSTTIYVGDIPVMVGSRISRKGRYSTKEEVDDGGYFIIAGKERHIPLNISTDHKVPVCYDSAKNDTTNLAIRCGAYKNKVQSTRLSKKLGCPLSLKFYGFYNLIDGAPQDSNQHHAKRRRTTQNSSNSTYTVNPGILLAALGVEQPEEVFEALPEEDKHFLGRDSFTLPDCVDCDESAAQGAFTGTVQSQKAAATVNAARMMSFMKRTNFQTERDSVLSRKVDGVCEMLTIVFERALKSSMALLKTRVEARLRKIHDLRNDNKKHRVATTSMPNAEWIGKEFFRFNCISSRMLYFLATGNLVGGTDGSNPRAGICQLLERTSHLQKQSCMNKVVSSLDSQNAPTSAREFMLCSLGRLCPVSTPEGKRTGLVGQKAVGASVSRDRKSCVGALKSCIAHLMLAVQGPAAAVAASTATGVWFSGVFQGLTKKPKQVVDALRKARRSGQLPRDVGVSVHGLGDTIVFIDVRLHAGRLMRPLIPLDIFREPLPKNSTWSQYMQEGHVEILDAREESGAYVASVETIATPKHTHREIFHAAALGACTATIPFLDHEPSPRAAYYTNQAQQSMGFDPRVYANRMSDSKTFQLYYPQKSLVNTSFEYSSKIEEEAPQGVNVSVVVLSFQGNEEDAILVSRAAVERGLFLGAEFNTKTIKTADRTKKCFAHPNASPDNPCSPVSSTECIKKEHHALDFHTGIARVGEQLKTGDAIACIAGVHGKTTVKHINTLPATVDRVLIYDEESGHRIVKVRTRTVRSLYIGDKVASRFSQKGVVGRLVNEEEMPWLEDGSGRIDMIINPCYIPSRMTVGQPAEGLLGFALATLGMSRGDASAFAHSTISIMQDLKKKGFKGHRKWLRCPITGQRLGDKKIDVALVKYNRLNKFSSDKCRIRTKGKRDLLNNQPSAGRNRGERAQRFGGMETTAVAAHGAALVLDDASRARSDGCTVNICKNCGSHNMRGATKQCAICGHDSVQVPSTTATIRMMQMCDALNIAMKVNT